MAKLGYSTDPAVGTGTQKQPIMKKLLIIQWESHTETLRTQDPQSEIGARIGKPGLLAILIDNQIIWSRPCGD